MRSARGAVQGHLAQENGCIFINQFIRGLQPVFRFEVYLKNRLTLIARRPHNFRPN